MLKFWTAQYRYPGPARLDISVKGNDPIGKYFAPTWDMLNLYKADKSPKGEQLYIEQYHRIITKNRTCLTHLLTMDELVLVCFCPPGEFCHRNLLTFYLVQEGATYMGEITDFSPWKSILAIDDFHKPHFEFLSNFYPSPFTYQNILYPTVEHFYQAWKFPSGQREIIAALETPGKAKAAGRKAKLCWNWDTFKIDLMHEGLKHKFAIPELEYKLLNTGKATLIEGNYWHDNFWGKCTCARCLQTIPNPKNMLGQLLMERREIIRQQHKEKLQ